MALAIALVGLIGGIDYLTGYEISFSLFYLFPISLATWVSGRNMGLATSLLSAIAWFSADNLAGHTYTNPAIPYWNTLIRLGFFATVTVLLSNLRRAHQTIQTLALTDHLTGAVNARHFQALAQMEMHRLRRYQRPFTIAYIDLDNFKMVNDHYGHEAGDRVLATVTRRMRRDLRSTDVVARLGGDEFALLLPETGREDAQTVVSKVRAGLADEMQQSAWPVTLSIGVVTFLKIPATVDAAIRLADHLMYAVKTDGKNSIRYSVYEGETAAAGGENGVKNV